MKDDQKLKRNQTKLTEASESEVQIISMTQKKETRNKMLKTKSKQ
jgi:hypothetical protein